MHSRLFSRRSSILLPLLPLALFIFSKALAQQNPSTLSAAATETYLFSEPEEHSQVITKLERGDKLVPVANALAGGEAWYMVRTPKGIVGWVKSSHVQGAETFEKMWRESASLPPSAGLPEAASSSPLEKSVTVPVEMSGSNIVVPVLVNGSSKTYMMMDTGATFTVVTPTLAKRLGLKLASRVPLMTANGRISAPLSRLASLKVGNAEVRGLVVAIHDFSPDPRLEGLLGLNFLSRFHTSIDSRQQRLTLAPR